MQVTKGADAPEQVLSSLSMEALLTGYRRSSQPVEKQLLTRDSQTLSRARSKHVLILTANQCEDITLTQGLPFPLQIQ
jgi:hypothetical protein